MYNSDQQNLLREAYNWWLYDKNPLFQYAGSGGTGKSFMLHAIINMIGIPIEKVAPAAYTGAASIVLRTKGFPHAKTEHAWLYKPVDVALRDKKGNLLMNDTFDVPMMGMGFVPKPMEGIELMVIDEAPMTPLFVRQEIERRRVKVIACGDLKQLPPVESPPGYLVDGKIHQLNQIMRQAEDNPIVMLSNRAYQGLPLHKGYYRSIYGSVLVIEEDELTDNMISWSDIMICGTNRTRDIMNKRVRENILNIKSELPQFGERLVCRKSNWNKEVDGISLANGLVGVVTSYPDVSDFDGKTFSIDFTPLILNKPFQKLRCNYEYLTSDYERRKVIKNNKYAVGEKMEYAYCITTHVSQGSEYANGIYFKEYLSKEINCNLDYTGISRFRNSCIIVLPKRKFY